jgi:hypothetical protein
METINKLSELRKSIVASLGQIKAAPCEPLWLESTTCSNKKCYIPGWDHRAWEHRLEFRHRPYRKHLQPDS